MSLSALQSLQGVSGDTNPSFGAIKPLSQPLAHQTHEPFIGGGTAGARRRA